MPSPIVFDIENGPLPLDQIKTILGEFDPTTTVGSRPDAFDQSAVKVGNLKDPAKIAEKVEAARAAHAERVANYDRDLADATDRYWVDVVSKAALDPTISSVVAIGYKSESGEVIHHETDRDEPTMLGLFWDRYKQCRRDGRRLVGFNSGGFDVPYIARRSFMLGVAVPGEALLPSGYLDQTFVDLLGRYQFGNRRDWISLDKLCRACGFHGKPEGVTGAMFYEMYRVVETRAAALAYLSNDLRMTWELAERLGVA